MNWRSKQLRLSINEGLINKNDLDDKQAFVEGWENQTITIDELAQSIKNGFAYCAELKGTRNAKNFKASDIISADLDDVGDIEAVKNNPLVKDHATLIYTTHSHKKEAPKLRIVFALERTIADATEMRAATRSLALRLSSDGSVVDAARLFYGSEGCDCVVQNKGIDHDFLDELINQGRNAQQLNSSHRYSNTGTGHSGLKFSPNLHVKNQAGDMAAVSSMPKSSSIHCPFHNDINASALITENNRGQKGIHCSTCGTTYWEKDASDGVDFFAFDKAARSIQEHSKVTDDVDQLFFQAQTKSFLGQAHVVFFENEYVENIEIDDGAYFIKSPKGSGKTEFLRGITEATKNESKRILLIGHRRSLIKQMCNRLDLNCYLDEVDTSSESTGFLFNRYGVCLDSIAKVPTNINYDYVFIDECEQVISHLLSETMDTKRNHVFRRFQHIVSKAKRVIALDADLSEVSFNHISKWSRKHDKKRKSHLWINKYHRERGDLFVFNKKNQLIGDLSRSISEGKRCYVTSNSKTQIEALEKTIRENHKSKKIIMITSGTVQDTGPVFDFLNNPTEQALRYDVILTSPSVSTGVDITFPDGAAEIDSVFAIFEPLVLTHFECDQQLMRVRNPKITKVYVAPRQFNFETNFNVVVEDILSLQMMDHVLENFNFDGQPEHTREDELLQIAASIISFQRASKNRLKKNFLEFKAVQGWIVHTQDEDEKVRAEGSILALEGKSLLNASAEEALMNARKVTRTELQALEERKEAEFALSTEDNAAYVRGLIETFYRKEISTDLIKLDNQGRYRAAVRRFEKLSNPKDKALADAIQKTRQEISLDRNYLFAEKHHVTQLVAECLEVAGLYKDGQFMIQHEVSKHNLLPFIEFIETNKTRFELVLGQHVPKDLREKPPSTLGQLLKLVGLSLASARTKTHKGTKTYLYRISPQKFSTISQTVADRKHPKTDN